MASQYLQQGYATPMSIVKLLRATLYPALTLLVAFAAPMHTALRVGVAAILVMPYALRHGLGGLTFAKALVVSAGAGAL